jgi:hypothetical protein
MRGSRLSFVISSGLALGVCFVAFAQQSTTGSRNVAQRHAVANFAELANRRTLAPSTTTTVRKALPRPMRRVGFAAPRLSLQSVPTASTSESLTLAAASQLPSPPATLSFLALSDDNTAIPPDTMGAVGADHVMTTLNSQVRIQDRIGGPISIVDLNSFWASVGNPNVFDPRLTYDSFNDRWICSGIADPDSASSAILVGVSETSDASGNWFLYSVDVDTNNLLWADFDSLGFNKNWIVVTANLFLIGGDFSNAVAYVFDKADLYASGSGAFTQLVFTDGEAFAVVPATTHDNSLDTLYLVEDWDGSTGELRISTITGTVGSELLSIGTAFPTTTNRWESFTIPNNLAPQLGSTNGIDVGDPRVLSCFYRNGSLWVAQSALLPIGAPRRSAAQWWQFTPTGVIQQFGRVDDPSGAEDFAYPSLAVNASNDVLIGYSRFSATQYASANYSFRFATDPANTLRTDIVLKAGEGAYFATDDIGLNRWGDYSSTVVDPVDDMSMWTIQQYAGTPAGNPDINGLGRWGTWWGRIDADHSFQKVSLTRPAEGVSYPTNATVTLTASQLDTNVTFTKVEFFAGATKIGETNTSPFTITWLHVPSGNYALTAIATDNLAGVSTSQVVNITVGDLMSTVGTWECKLGGAAKGTAYVTFLDDLSVSGHGMTLGTFGLFTISGAWNYNAKHQTVGTYTETFNGVNIYTGSVLAKVRAGKKLSGTVTPTGLAKRLKFSGPPAAAAPDLTGSWSAKVKTLRVTTNETYQFTASPTFFNVLDLVGQGPTYALTGTVVVTSRGLLNASTTNDVKRSLSGKSKLGTSFALKGKDNLGNSVSIKATKP